MSLLVSLCTFWFYSIGCWNFCFCSSVHLRWHIEEQRVFLVTMSEFLRVITFSVDISFTIGKMVHKSVWWIIQRNQENICRNTLIMKIIIFYGIKEMKGFAEVGIHISLDIEWSTLFKWWHPWYYSSFLFAQQNVTLDAILQVRLIIIHTELCQSFRY